MSFCRRILFSAVIFTVFFAAACDAEDEIVLGEYDQDKSTEVRELMAAELNVGDAASSIESFFERNDISFSYDRFAQRYQAIIRDVSSDPNVDQAIVIYVAVDDEKRLLSFEVKDSFTAP